jgi:hypothetical protein
MRQAELHQHVALAHVLAVAIHAPPSDLPPIRRIG